MQSPPPKNYQRRSPEQWKEIIEQHNSSGLSGKKFCDTQGIGYASFCKWRQKLTEVEIEQSSQPANPSFIDLGSLAATNEPNWHIVLKLGNGIELCLSQANVPT